MGGLHMLSTASHQDSKNCQMQLVSSTRFDPQPSNEQLDLTLGLSLRLASAKPKSKLMCKLTRC